MRLYIVDLGMGDCPAGCGKHALFVFVGQGDGVSELGSFEDATTNAPQLPPEYHALAKACAENLTSSFYHPWFDE